MAYSHAVDYNLVYERLQEARDKYNDGIATTKRGQQKTRLKRLARIAAILANDIMENKPDVRSVGIERPRVDITKSLEEIANAVPADAKTVSNDISSIQSLIGVTFMYKGNSYTRYPKH